MSDNPTTNWHVAARIEQLRDCLLRLDLALRGAAPTVKVQGQDPRIVAEKTAGLIDLLHEAESLVEGVRVAASEEGDDGQ